MTKTMQHTRTSHRHIRIQIAEENKYYLLQKLFGVTILIFFVWAGFALSCFECFVLGGLFGLPLLFCKDKIIMAGKVYWDENPKNIKQRH